MSRLRRITLGWAIFWLLALFSAEVLHGVAHDSAQSGFFGCECAVCLVHETPLASAPPDAALEATQAGFGFASAVLRATPLRDPAPQRACAQPTIPRAPPC